MKNKLFNSVGLLLFVLVAGSLFPSCSPKKEVKETLAAVTVPTKAEYILKGAYLTKVGGCNDCHTPKLFTERGMELDTSRLLSGHPAESPLPEIDTRALQPGYWVLFNGHSTAALGPWGLTYARNLTPHETGIKGWKEEGFIKALRTGQHMGTEAGRAIMPPMPWFNLAEAEEEDLKAIFHYLQSLKPVDNYVPEPISPEEVVQMATAAEKAKI